MELTDAKDFQAAIDYLDKNLQVFVTCPLNCSDNKIVVAEMTLAVNLAKFACKIGLARIDVPTQKLEKASASKRKALSAEFENLIKEHKKLWIVRNRPGGLHKSVEKFERCKMYLQK